MIFNKNKLKQSEYLWCDFNRKKSDTILMIQSYLQCQKLKLNIIDVTNMIIQFLEFTNMKTFKQIHHFSRAE